MRLPTRPNAATASSLQPTRTVQRPVVRPPLRHMDENVPAWLDNAIYIVVGLLVFLIARKLL
jgi:hypothetical protein